MIRVRNLRLEGIGHLGGVSFLGHVLLRVVVQLVCVQQGIHTIHLHVVSQLVHQSDVSALIRVRAGIHFRRRLGRGNDFFLNFRENMIQLRSLGCGLVEGCFASV